MHLSHSDTTYNSRKPSSMLSAPIHQLEGEPTKDRAGTCHIHPPNTAASWHDWHVTVEHVNRDHRTSATTQCPSSQSLPCCSPNPVPSTLPPTPRGNTRDEVGPPSRYPGGTEICFTAAGWQETGSLGTRRRTQDT